MRYVQDPPEVDAEEFDGSNAQQVLDLLAPLALDDSTPVARILGAEEAEMAELPPGSLMVQTDPGFGPWYEVVPGMVVVVDQRMATIWTADAFHSRYSPKAPA